MHAQMFRICIAVRLSCLLCPVPVPASPQCPPSLWQRAQLAQILHFKPTIDSLLELKLPRPDALNPSQPDRSIPTVPSFLSRQGVLFSAESKWTYVKRSDGVHSAAGIIITWRLAEDANEQMEQMEQALRSRKQHTAPHATAATATTTSAAPAATRDA